MQVSERENGATAGNGLDSPTTSDAQPEPLSPPKRPSLDLFNLVVSYKRLELYLEPLQDIAEGVWFLLRLVPFPSMSLCKTGKTEKQKLFCNYTISSGGRGKGCPSGFGFTLKIVCDLLY